MSFEDLRRDYDATLGRIGDTLDLTRTGQGAFDPVPCRVGYVPSAVAELTEAEEAQARAHVQGVLEQLAPVLEDALAAGRCRQHRLQESAELEHGSFEVRDAAFAKRRGE